MSSEDTRRGHERDILAHTGDFFDRDEGLDLKIILIPSHEEGKERKRKRERKGKERGQKMTN